MRGGETIPELFGHRFKQTRKLYEKGNIKGHKLQGKNEEANVKGNTYTYTFNTSRFFAY